jgi:cell shape-determining protein MreC
MGLARKILHKLSDTVAGTDYTLQYKEFKVCRRTRDELYEKVAALQVDRSKLKNENDRLMETCWSQDSALTEALVQLEISGGKVANLTNENADLKLVVHRWELLSDQIINIVIDSKRTINA